MQKSTKLLLILAMGTLLALAGTYLFPPTHNIASETEFILLDGNRVKLKSWRGHPVLVSFWATSCPPCVEELPDLIRFYQEWHPKGLEMVAVAMPYDPPTRVQEFVKQHSVPYPVALDVQGMVTSAFGGVPNIPTAFVLAPDGKTELRYVGRLDIPKAQRIIARFLNEPAP